MKRFIPFVVFIVATALGLTIAWQTYQAGQEASRLRFEAVASDVVDLVEERIGLHVSLLRSVEAFLSSEPHYTERVPFARFVSSFGREDYYRGAQGYGFAQLVRKGDEEQAEARMEANYGLEKEIHPATDQEWRAPIIILEPPDARNLSAVGYDMFADPVRRAAMLRSMKTGQPAASAKVELVQELNSENKQSGFLLYLPLFRGDTPPKAARRPEQLLGFIYAPYRVGDLFETVLDRGPAASVSFSVWDDEETPENLLYASPRPASPKYGDGYTVEKSITVGGRIWYFHLRPTAGFRPVSSIFETLTIAVVSIFLAGALAMLTRSQARRLEIADVLNAEVEHNLAQKDLMLQEMKHRNKNLLSRVLAIARQTAGSADDLDAFQASFSARMQAMANAQDLLTRSSWQKADLRELVMAELSQVFGDSIDESAVEGPDIQLSERMTQALGLTVHELATNALKYGNVTDADGGLDVSWSLEPAAIAARGRAPTKTLRFCWSETGAGKLVPSDKKGFGTRLIEANIRGELGGTIEREYGNDGLNLTLEVPLA